MNHSNAEKAEKGYTIYTGAFQGHSEVEFMILQHKVTRLEKQIEAMKMCGNCKHMDIIDTFGGICLFEAGVETPTSRDGYCPDWQLEIK